MEFYPTDTKGPEIHGSVLILPIVSTGNVAQLAVDLLISTFEFKRIGILDSRYLVPAVGGREDGEEGITTPIELYQKKGSKVLAIQQRSPAMKSHKAEFISSLLSFIESSQISLVIILSGMDLSNRPDAHMQATTYHFIPERAGIPLPSILEELKTHVPSLAPSTITAGEIPGLPGSGLTRQILSSLPAFFPPTGLILEYALEGDNRDDARILAGAVARCLQKELGITGQEGWREPSSWKEGLFGTTHDQTLFG
ncbi:hypothetical protein FRB93_010008 [Tulasnella sp. JGI-2019a]|nr:hypothetical protein FRB93_010008 [Tulasnella sp. JGI-2019a]